MENDNLWTGKTILIADDSRIIRGQLEALYSSMGLIVIESAPDGVKAVEIFERERPDLVSLDIIMPEMHGFDCYRHLKVIDPEFNFIFVSCLAAEAANSEHLQGEIASQLFVAKPATKEVVEKAFSFALGDFSQPLIESASPASRSPVAS